MTTNYTLDLNSGLTQVLSDGTTDYLYGNGRIAQVNTTTEHFLGDALGSVRQMTDQAGAVTLAQSYDPYGTVTSTGGTSSTPYGFTGEQYSVETQMLYLRARYYNPLDGRFQSRDTWGGDVMSPLSLNRWMYVEGNPVNLVDPTGLVACSNSLDPECIRLARNLRAKAASLKRFVKNGTVLPVEALAQLVDYANDKFADPRGMMWGVTNVLLGIDPNSVSVWKLGLSETDRYGDINPASNPYFIGQNWLLYKHNPQIDEEHSEQGDWRGEYWDETPNQAYHFWYFAAVEYYNNWLIATLANRFHDPYLLECVLGDDLEIIGNEDITKLFDGTSREDYLLGNKGIEFGRMMWRYWRTGVVNPGGWIRVNLSSTYK